MSNWKNLDTLDSYKVLSQKEQVNLADVMSGENGAKRVQTYQVPMAAGLSYNYASKQVNDDILKALSSLAEEAELAEKYNVQKVILFGSRARGDFKRTSDIDLAVSGGDFCRFALDVEEETQTLLEFDIVDLDGTVQEELLESIRKEGYYMKKYENFCSSLKNMKEIYNYTEPYDNVVLTGLVGLYEICFEQSWKMMKEILELHGFEEGATRSPKIILKTAFKAGMIKDEELWLQGLQARNNVTHSYNQNIALGIVKDAKEKFYDMFVELKREIEENWLE